ncbi:zinc finger protein ZAT5-like [Zingiber officinale]|uniref:C2H2-type domain-containing protein n=1 Tax=Zingiber officinale TaxID=94328 RepID=A0A8J5LFV7_ZINOF|nr:zinc finger protein ZAT5-like [Zingiber officinale]KAG6513722.1 hypothetical protein ZIOFF_024058 [Zingiber officinale]
MELAVEEGNSSASGSIDDVEFAHAVINKRKRTKRHRTQHPPPPPPVADSSSASSAETVSGTITEEEEDMANCLILLAQGRAFSEPEKRRRDEKFAGRRLAGGAGKAAGEFLYACKTCNKCFPSFQALGGHRTSHKKPNLAAILAPTPAEENKRKLPIVPGDDNLLQISLNSSFSAKPKLHECAICGSEFSTGQALGGHMRRHRPMAVADVHAHASAKKDKTSFLSFDLNLPAAAYIGEAQSPPSPSTLSSPDLPQLWWRAGAITEKKE